MNEEIVKSMGKSNDEWDGLLFGVKRSVRYHLYRRKFFSFWKAFTDFSVIASGGTVISVASAGDKKTWIVIAAGAVTAFFGTLDLVLGFSDKARNHRDLVESFSELEADMAADAKTKEHLVGFIKRRLEIEVDEPPIMHVLNEYCHNELVIAMDSPPENLADIKWWQSWLKQFMDICPQRIKTRKQIEDARIADEKNKAAAIAAPKSA